MTVHVVAFAEGVLYEGTDREKNIGRHLLREIPRKYKYKDLLPGDKGLYDRGSFWMNLASDRTVDFESSDSFMADLHLTKDFEYGDSYTTLVDSKTGIFYPMFTTDFIETLFHVNLIQGHLTGRFGYIKKGARFGIKYLESV